MSINLFPMLMLPSWFRPTFCVKWTSVNKSYWGCYLALNHFQYSFQNCISKRKTNQAMSLRKLFHVAIYLRITSTYLWHKGPLWCHTSSFTFTVSLLSCTPSSFQPFLLSCSYSKMPCWFIPTQLGTCCSFCQKLPSIVSQVKS